jgi:hypothetical protein
MYKLVLILIVTITIGLPGCNKDKTHTSVLGSWNCEEFSDDLEGKRIYQVTIQRREEIVGASNEYKIFNFHKLGDIENSEVFVTENEPGILTITGCADIRFSFTGEGVVAADFTIIEWTYQVNDGATNPLVKANYY